jgi:predicted dehydrogenase
MGSDGFFKTDKRLKLGIWGLGRGQSFIASAKALNIDVVAGCDFHENMRATFGKNCPDAFLTGDENEFLERDFDAVLVATYCPNHAAHAIKATKAGKHVLSEVTAFFTLAQGVELVEAVEKYGKVYNLAENYPFSVENMYLAKLWREGFFGDLAYAEYEYVHGVGRCFSNPDGTPLEPGNRVHHWRGWLNYHYYCTHSLGPVMVITGLRPEKVTAFPDDVENYGVIKGKGRKIDGILPTLGAFAPSLIQMSNGGIMRNLMGGTTADSHHQRLFGTKASAEMHPLYLKVGATGSSFNIRVKPQWSELGELAEKAGHGGGDFWELYYFARQILTGEKAPWDIYAASDVTLAGIQALRSAEAEGAPMEIPDFRQKAVRDRYRNDNWMQKHIDPYRIFPDNQDMAITGDFSAAGLALNHAATRVRQALDAMKAFHVAVPEDQIRIITLVKEVRDAAPEYAKTYARARNIVDAYPDSQGGRALGELLVDVGEESRVMNTDNFVSELNNWLLIK